MAVNVERVALWVDALESGDYHQAVGSLRKMRYWEQPLSSYSYCCLGVATEVALANGCILTDFGPGLTGSVAPTLYRSWNGSLPQSVWEWYGFDSQELTVTKGANPYVGKCDEIKCPVELHLIDAVQANDQLNWNFARIAAGLRELYLGGDTVC